VEAVRCILCAVVPFNERTAYVVKAVHLMPHRHPKRQVLLP
jgi:hypothetical protein